MVVDRYIEDKLPHLIQRMSRGEGMSYKFKAMKCYIFHMAQINHGKFLEHARTN